MDQRQDGGIDGGRIDQRLIALNVHNYVGVFGRCNFRGAVCTRKMIGARQTYDCSELPGGLHDAIVVGGDDCAGQVTGLGGTFIDVLEHGFGGDLGENFTRKTSGREARGNHAQYFTRHRR